MSLPNPVIITVPSFSPPPHFTSGLPIVCLRCHQSGCGCGFDHNLQPVGSSNVLAQGIHPIQFVCLNCKAVWGVLRGWTGFSCPLCNCVMVVSYLPPSITEMINQGPSSDAQLLSSLLSSLQPDQEINEDPSSDAQLLSSLQPDQEINEDPSSDAQLLSSLQPDQEINEDPNSDAQLSSVQPHQEINEEVPRLRGTILGVKINENCGVNGAKRELHAICGKKKWSIPLYSIIKETGPPHDKKFMYSVTIQTPDVILRAEGEEMTRRRDAGGSAALVMLHGLQKNNEVGEMGVVNCGINSAKRVLHAVCGKRKWSNPLYSVLNEAGPPHDKKFKYSVSIETADGTLRAEGEEMKRIRDAEGSAALVMLHDLQNNNDI